MVWSGVEILRGERGWLALYLAIALLVTLPGLGATGVNGMEGMIADTAANVLESGEPIVTRLYGELHTYKPPFVYWLSALSIGLGGQSELTLRLPAALSTVAMGLAIALLVGRVTRLRTGCLAALAATTAGLPLQEAKQGEFDAVLAAAVGVAVAAACHNLAAAPARRSSWIWVLCYLALTAGCLAKGGLALMAFAPGLLAATAVTRRWRLLVRWDHLAAAALFGALVGGYLWALWARVGPVAFDQPLAEAGSRSLAWSLDALRQTLQKPFIIAAAFLPWSLAWAWSRGPARSLAEDPESEAAQRLLLAGRAFLVAGIVTFMAVPTHHTRYYVPLAAAAGIVAAGGLERLAERSTRLARRLALLLAGLVALASIGLGLSADSGIASRFAPAVVGAAALAAVAWLARSRPRYLFTWALLAAALCYASAETWVGRQHRAILRDLGPVARQLEAEIPPGETVWALGHAEPVGEYGSLYYYLGRRVRTIHEGQSLPAPGSFVVVTGEQLPDLAPELAARLALVRRVDHPWQSFVLFRVDPPPAGGRPGARGR